MIVLHDLPGVAVGLALGPLLFVAPGYVAGRVADPAGFRAGGAGFRLLLSLPLSVAVTPLLAYLLLRPGVPGLVWAGFGLVWAAFAGCLVADAGVLRTALARAGGRAAAGWAAAGVAAAGLLVASLVDMEIDGGLFRALSTHDAVKHTFVADAISRTGAPPANPCYYPGRPVPLYYYYLWFILPALTDQLAGPWANPREAVTACTAWTGFALAALVAVLLAAWDVKRLRPGRRAVAVGLALLAVTGLDVVPFYWSRAVGMPYSGRVEHLSVEWWGEDQVTAWANVVLWVPHHLGGLIACFTGFLVLDRMVQRPGERPAAGAVVAGAAFASALGQSVWVGLTGAAVLGVWFLAAVARRDWREVGPHLAAAAATAVLAAPFVLDLLRAGQAGGSPVILHVRHLDAVNVALAAHGVTRDSPVWWAAHVLCLPIFYLFELGFFLVAGVAYWRDRRTMPDPLSRPERFLACSAAVGLGLSTFVRSAIVNNDFGWRATMFAQLPLLLWAVPVCQRLFGPADARPPARPWLLLALGVGLFGTATELVLHRVKCEGERGDYALHLRHAYEWADAHEPPDAVLQHNPDRDYEFVFGLYAFRQAAVVDRVYGSLFGVSPAALAEVLGPCVRMFQADATPADVAATCRRFGITVLVVRYEDPIWAQPAGWGRACPAVYETDMVRVVRVAELRAWAGLPD